MQNIIETFDQAKIRQDWRTEYDRYRYGRLKHHYWLHNRKNTKASLIDSYDHSILRNCQSGTTVFFASAGYYIKDIFPDVEVVEMHPVVKTFFPEIHLCEHRSDLVNLPIRADNFAVVNNRGDHWVDVQGLTEHMTHYTKIMRPGCRVFYSFRDTQIHVNRLRVDLAQHFFDWAESLRTSLDLRLAWHDIQFPKHTMDDVSENPDSINGNLKFWFSFGADPWQVIT